MKKLVVLGGLVLVLVLLFLSVLCEKTNSKKYESIVFEFIEGENKNAILQNLETSFPNIRITSNIIGKIGSTSEQGIFVYSSFDSIVICTIEELDENPILFNNIKKNLAIRDSLLKIENFNY